ncbi:MAG: hypothetical protein CVU36_22065, partial [Betaproteobacteria bacterium HGW-Betaproteobacteria-9]
ARSRTSGENWFDFLLMAQSSQRKEPPQNTGRFRLTARIVPHYQQSCLLNCQFFTQPPEI